MPEVAIVRTEIFTVESTSLDGYGSLVILDKAGQEHKVNKKHESLHHVFQAGLAVEVGYGNFMDHDFIHTAKAVAEGLAPPVVSKPASTEEQPAPKIAIAPQAVGKTGYKADPAKMSSIERQVAIKLACDISSDTESLEQVLAKAEKIFQWISKT